MAHPEGTQTELHCFRQGGRCLGIGVVICSVLTKEETLSSGILTDVI